MALDRGVCALGALAHLAPVLAWLPPASPSAPSELRLLVANVLTGNQEHRRLLDLVAEERPDVVALLEVDATWLAALAPLAGTYPHRVVEPRDDNFGIALLSRRPLGAAAIVELGPFELPVIDARVEGAFPVRIVVAHPPPPISAAHAEARDAILVEVAARVAGDPRAVVVGDLNCTPWVAPFRRLLRDGALRDSRIGQGNQASWPTRLGPLGIPIDHALVGPAVGIGGRRLGPSIGSDHRPLLIGLHAQRPEG